MENSRGFRTEVTSGTTYVVEIYCKVCTRNREAALQGCKGLIRQCALRFIDGMNFVLIHTIQRHFETASHLTAIRCESEKPLNERCVTSTDGIQNTKSSKYQRYLFGLNGKLNASDQLETACLSWYKTADNEAHSQLKFVGLTEVTFPGGSVVLLESSKSKFTFKIQFNHTKFNFKASDDETRQRWIYAFCDLVGKRLPPCSSILPPTQIKSDKGTIERIAQKFDYDVKMKPKKDLPRPRPRPDLPRPRPRPDLPRPRPRPDLPRPRPRPDLPRPRPRPGTKGCIAQKLDNDDKMKPKKDLPHPGTIGCIAQKLDNDDKIMPKNDLPRPRPRPEESDDEYSNYESVYDICGPFEKKESEDNDEYEREYEECSRNVIYDPFEKNLLYRLTRPGCIAQNYVNDVEIKLKKDQEMLQRIKLKDLPPLPESSFNEPNEEDFKQSKEVNKVKDALSKVVDNQESQKLFMKFFYESKAPITDDIKASIEKQEWEILINEKTTRYEVIYQEYFLDCFISEKKMWRLIVTKNILTKDEINLIIKCSTNICDAIFYCSFEMEGWKPSKTIEWLTIDIHISLISKKDFNTFYPWISVCEGLSLFLHDEIDYIEEIYRHIQDQSSLQEFFIEYRGKIFVSSKN